MENLCDQSLLFYGSTVCVASIRLRPLYEWTRCQWHIGGLLVPCNYRCICLGVNYSLDLSHWTKTERSTKSIHPPVRPIHCCANHLHHLSWDQVLSRQKHCSGIDHAIGQLRWAVSLLMLCLREIDCPLQPCLPGFRANSRTCNVARPRPLTLGW